MQVSEHPTDLFAGLAAVDPLFLSQGDGVGIVVAIVAASRTYPIASSICCGPGDLPRVSCGTQAHGRVVPTRLAVIPRLDSLLCLRRRNRTQALPEAIKLCTSLGLARGLFSGRCPFLEAAELLKPSIRLKRSDRRFWMGRFQGHCLGPLDRHRF